jgi:type IV pilus assembly protein PilN
VIRINLLPHREAARKRRRERFNLAVGASTLLGGAMAWLIFLGYSAEISDQQNSNRVLTVEVGRLDAQIREMTGLQAEMAVLKARQQAVERLQADRNGPVHLLAELVKQLPDGVFIAKLVQTGQVVTLNGMAQSSARVSELLRNWEHHASWLGKAELVEIAAASTVLPSKEQRRTSSFVIRVRLVHTDEAEKRVAPVGAVADRVGTVATHGAVVAATAHD